MALRYTIIYESISFSNWQLIEKKSLEESRREIRCVIVTNVLAEGLSLDHFFNSKHEVSVVIDRARALKQEIKKDLSSCSSGAGSMW